jgi:hypothetical protein
MAIDPVPIPHLVAYLGLAALIACGIYLIIKHFIDDCINKSVIVCGSAGVKSTESSVTFGLNVSKGKVGCSSECIIICNSPS